MALDFPDTPAVGDVYGTWKWDGLRWVAITVTGVRGAVAYSQSTTTQNIATTTPTDLSDMSVSWIASPTRTYRTSVFFLASSTVVNDDLNADIVDAVNTRKQLFPNPYLDPSTSITMSASLVETGLTGTIYRKVRAWRSGTGTMSIAGDVTYPRYILVEDITYEAGPTGGSGGGGGSGFTFVQDTKPTAERQGDTWFNTATDAGGGRSAVAVYEGSAGTSELVWVQFSPMGGSANYALGIMAWGSYIAGGGYQLPVGTTTITNPLAFTTLVGRRYRLKWQIRVIASTAGNGINLAWIGSGVTGTGYDMWENVTAAYGHFSGEVVFSGTGVVSSYGMTATVTAVVQLYLDTVSNFYIEDVGPVR